MSLFLLKHSLVISLVATVVKYLFNVSIINCLSVTRLPSINKDVNILLG